MHLDNKKIWIITLAAAFVIVVVLVCIHFRRPAEMTNAPVGQGQVPEGSAAPGTPSVPQSKTRAAAPAMPVPDLGAQVSAGIAVPTVVANAAPDSDSSFRVFLLKIQNNAFTPSTIVMREGDIAHITVAAIDKNYDITQPDFGIKASITKGKSKVVEFSAPAPGKFTFFCSSCGGPDKGPVGYFIIEPKSSAQ